MNTLVRTRQGKIEGREERGLLVCRGIPYAEPPVGGLRFRRPQPPASWRGTRPAAKFGRASPQNLPRIRILDRLIGVGRVGQSEDSLYLNVWTPAPDRQRRPVLVWIHGGAFVIGSGSTVLYAGGRLAKRGDVVVVTINYRLGAFGYLNARGLDDELEANFGLRDQIAALEWVRDNIEQFGGDPDNVTIFGESAGGMSVGTLLGTPAASSLFRRAVAQSGAASNVSPPDQATAIAEELLRQLGMTDFDAEELRRHPVDAILDAQMRAAMKVGFRLGVLPWQPSIDDQLLCRMPLEAIGSGLASTKQVMVGTNRDEWRLFMLADTKGRRLDEDGLRRRFTRALAEFEGRGGEPTDLAYEVYTRAGNGRRGWTPSERWIAFQSDRIFHQPAQALAETHAGHGAGTYSYLFTWAPPLVGSWLGSFHGLEIPFVFGTVRDPPLRQLIGFQGSVRRLSETVQDAWIAFARQGDPSAPAVGAWPPYDVARRATMLLGPDNGIREAVFEDRRRFWQDLSNLSAVG